MFVSHLMIDVLIDLMQHLDSRRRWASRNRTYHKEWCYTSIFSDLAESNFCCRTFSSDLPKYHHNLLTLWKCVQLKDQATWGWQQEIRTPKKNTNTWEKRGWILWHTCVIGSRGWWHHSLLSNRLIKNRWHMSLNFCQYFFKKDLEIAKNENCSKIEIIFES